MAMGDHETARTGNDHMRQAHGQDHRGEDPPVPMLTAAETAALLGVSTMTVYRLIRRGTLTALRVGSVYRIPQRAAQTYLDELRLNREALRRASKP
ncbi:hypothetical protein GCM10007147_04140 [Nocardiopsis kunsanensis]|uniref:Helix-turn-helix domain-containing protein n=2 Tax=Nocardiopsis kunsanensis TaxID=141693 RepID=A0A918X7Y1_9ACTN|nr:hypothetical protein GCM10007147_04140 [Nocardiopsis kunsanensis]